MNKNSIIFLLPSSPSRWVGTLLLRCLGFDIPSLHVSQEASVFSLPSFLESEEVGRTAAGWRQPIFLEDILSFLPLGSLAYSTHQSSHYSLLYVQLGMWTIKIHNIYLFIAVSPGSLWLGPLPSCSCLLQLAEYMGLLLYPKKPCRLIKI